MAKAVTRRDVIVGTAAVGLAGAVAGTLTGANRAQAEEAHESAVTSYYQCKEDWLGLPPETGEPAETYDCDVLVLGGGHAGIHAALAAAEGGAKVIVVEKWAEDMRKVKGEDIGHINSQWLIDQGYGPYDVGEVTNEFVRRAGGRCNPEIIRKYLANSGEMFDHLQSLVTWPDDRIKLMPTTERNPDASPFDPSQVICQVSGATADGPVEYPMMCGGNGSYAAVAQFMGEISHDNSIPGCAAMSRLDEVMQFAILKGEELGAEWHYGERALKLTTDESGAVTGAISQKVDDEDTYVQYNAKTGVILCLGDYGGDNKMVWNLNPDISEFNSRQGLTEDDLFSPFADCTGDGQKMACWVGAVMEPTPRASMNTGGGGGGPWGTCPYLFLNANGERFCNEANAVGVTEATLLQPVGIVTTMRLSRTPASTTARPTTAAPCTTRSSSRTWRPSSLRIPTAVPCASAPSPSATPPRCTPPRPSRVPSSWQATRVTPSRPPSTRLPSTTSCAPRASTPSTARTPSTWCRLTRPRSTRLPRRTPRPPAPAS